jgi:endonuclease YncB( thermonuclease family)
MKPDPRRHLLVVIALLTATVTAPLTAAARSYSRGDTIIGPVSQVIDGDTIVIDDIHVRLYGIDAPEYNQTCADANGAPYLCGKSATDHMSRLIGASIEPCRSERMHGNCVRTSRPVVCNVMDMDRQYGRPVARCTSSGTDLSRQMVVDGWASAYARYSHDYVPAQAIAQSQKRGMWSGNTTNPAIWRHKR